MTILSLPRIMVRWLLKRDRMPLRTHIAVSEILRHPERMEWRSVEDIERGCDASD